MRTVEERFWVKVTKSDNPDGCWTWNKSCFPGGYGQFKEVVNCSPQRAHRFSWKLHFGEIPQGLLVLHKCDNPPCVRPDHLFLGTHAINSADKIQKGRQGWNMTKGQNSSRAKLTQTQVDELRVRHSQGESMRSLGREFGLDNSNVCRAINGITYKE